MNSIRKLKLDFFNNALYLISPILAIPTIFLSLIYRTKYSLLNYSLLIAFISFSFIPEANWDKVRHIEFYEYVKDMSFAGFFTYNFSETPDFVFGFLLYLGGVLGIRVHFIFFFVTFITIYLVMKVFDDFLEQELIINKKYLLLLIPLFLLSFSYMDIISGFRYALAVSLSIYGIYFGLVRKKGIRGLLFILLGIFTHFSVMMFALLYIAYPILNKIDNRVTKILLLLSFLFILIPQEVYLQIANGLGLENNLQSKASAYLNNENFQQDGSFAIAFIRFFDIVWIYTLTFIILINKQTKTIYFTYLVWGLIITNTFISFPIIYNRYALFLKILIALYCADNLIRERKSRHVILFITLFAMVALNQFIVMRNGYFDIFLMPEKMVFLYQIIENNFSSTDVYLLR